MRPVAKSVMFVLAALPAGGCARPAATVETAAEASAAPVILADERGIVLGQRARSQSMTIKASPVAAWRVAKRVYEALSIPVTHENPTAHQIGNKDFWKTRSVGPLRMAEVVDCGVGATGRKADYYRIYMTLVTTIGAHAGGGTLLQTTLIAFGQDVSGGNADRIPCGSSGILESLINESIRDNSVGK